MFRVFCALLTANLCFAGSPSSDSLSLNMNDGRVVVGTVESAADGVVVVKRHGGDWVFRMDQFTPESLILLGKNTAGAPNLEARCSALEKENASLRALVLSLQTENLNLRLEFESQKRGLPAANANRQTK